MITKVHAAPKLHSKLFEGEKLLVIVSVLGMFLAFVCGLYISMYGDIVAPEGNVGSALSFNLAIAIFILTIAAFLPLSGLSGLKRTRIRRGFVLTVLISYGIETIQHFRGINPRFTRAGSIPDMVAGGFFGLVSMVLIVLTILLAVSFLGKDKMMERPNLILGIRYGFLSTMIAFLSGIGMIILQSRYIGHSGNFMVIHGLGFHALQALPLLGWLSERAKSGEKRGRKLIHLGSISWLTAILLIGIHSVQGRTMFEMTMLPILAAGALLIWLSTVVMAWLDQPIQDA